MKAVWIFFICLSAGCSSFRRVEPEPPRLSVLSYNAGRLLDTEHDVRRIEKLHRVAAVIRESKTGCPDIVVLQDVENRAVLQRLAKIELADCGYDGSAMADVRDGKGAALAILSKFPIEHPESLRGRDVRGILSAGIASPGKSLHLVGVHLPAAPHSVQLRQAGLNFLAEIYGQDQTVATIFAGDWGVPGKEDRELQMFQGLRHNFWVSDDEIRKTASDQGTFYSASEAQWSFLDKILVNRNFVDQLTCQVTKSLAFQSDSSNRPQPFPELSAKGTRLVDEPGVSDHFPVLCQFAY